MREVKKSTEIVHLDLTQNNLSAKSAKRVFKSLMSNQSVISLRIGNTENDMKNKLGVIAVPKLNSFLRQSQILTFLDLRSTNLTDAGIELLSEGLVDNKTILYLNLSKNDITCSGMEPFAPILPKTAITELDLSMNPLGNNGVIVFAENGLFAKK